MAVLLKTKDTSKGRRQIYRLGRQEGGWVCWLPLATRDICRDEGDAGVTVSRTKPMHHINDHCADFS